MRHSLGWLTKVNSVHTSSCKPISELRSVTCHMRSHSITCHLTQVNAPSLNPSHAGRHSICLPWRDGRLSWPCSLVTYHAALPVHRQSSILACKVNNKHLSLTRFFHDDSLTLGEWLSFLWKFQVFQTTNWSPCCHCFSHTAERQQQHPSIL